MDTSRRYDRDMTGKKLGDRGIVAHEDRAITAVNFSSLNQMAHDFRAEIPYKYRCYSFVSQLLINRKEIKQF